MNKFLLLITFIGFSQQIALEKKSIIKDDQKLENKNLWQWLLPTFQIKTTKWIPIIHPKTTKLIKTTPIKTTYIKTTPIKTSCMKTSSPMTKPFSTLTKSSSSNIITSTSTTNISTMTKTSSTLSSVSPTSTPLRNETLFGFCNVEPCKSTTFDDLYGRPVRWGWSLEIQAGDFPFQKYGELIAGQFFDVGDLFIGRSNGILTIKYEVHSTDILYITHVYAGAVPINQVIDPPSPGKYGNQHINVNSQTDTFILNIGANPLYLVIHADVGVSSF